MITKKDQLAHYKEKVENKKQKPCIDTETKLRGHAVRSWSGVVVITTVMKPSKFSCPHDCHYCPNEPGQPRSYLSSEPAVARANQVDFDAVGQFYSRAKTLERIGHRIDKIELIILGGTFSSYPREYQTDYIRDLYYAANVYPVTLTKSRKRHSLQIEKKINEKSEHRIIGCVLETRPDSITPYELHRFRKLGCTRIQIGVQHTDDSILEKVNRGHGVKESITAIKLIRQAGFKLDIHIMPDLPGTTPYKDKEMIKKVLTEEEFKPDHLKLYPCLDADFSVLRDWKTSGEWEPYAEKENGDILLEVCLTAKIYSQYFCRFNRIQRDFPEAKPGLIGYESETIPANFRQLLMAEAKSQGIDCKCIRCREPKHRSPKRIKYFTEKYRASEGEEYFVSAESPNRSILYGFVRVRIQDEQSKGQQIKSYFPELEGAALVRELHVYGTVIPVNEKRSKQHSTQHRGIGTSLMRRAENISVINSKNKVAVISGVGVREFYKAKLNYKLVGQGEYMIKDLNYAFVKLRYLIVLVQLFYNNLKELSFKIKFLDINKRRYIEKMCKYKLWVKNNIINWKRIDVDEINLYDYVFEH